MYVYDDAKIHLKDKGSKIYEIPLKTWAVGDPQLQTWYQKLGFTEIVHCNKWKMIPKEDVNNKKLKETRTIDQDPKKYQKAIIELSNRKLCEIYKEIIIKEYKNDAKKFAQTVIKLFDKNLKNKSYVSTWENYMLSSNITLREFVQALIKQVSLKDLSDSAKASAKMDQYHMYELLFKSYFESAEKEQTQSVYYKKYNEDLNTFNDTFVFLKPAKQ